MKKRKVVINLIGLMAITLMVFQACKKDDTPDNKLPTCSITSPIPAQEITVGETITISATATDTDGTITEVRFYVDDAKVGTIVTPPYNYEWNTSTESIGDHALKATCVDNDNGSASDEIAVVVIEERINIIDPRDGQKYYIVEIGSQTWFAENLNYESTDSWWYNNSAANGEIYGRLYTWDAAQNACPEGWSLPSDDAWKTLEMGLGMSQDTSDLIFWRGTEGVKMKSTSGWLENGNGTNSSEFTGLPGGYYINSYGGLGKLGYWWTSSETAYYNSAWQRGLNNLDGRIFRFDGSKNASFSVRCIKD